MSISPENINAKMDICTKCNKVFGDIDFCPICKKKLNKIDYDFFNKKKIGKYNIHGILGEGGMGCVFLAEHPSLKKMFALKIFSHIGHSSLKKRFLREAKLLAGLKHPNIVEILDMDLSEWGFHYYVMDFIKGETLKRKIINSKSGLSINLVKDYLTQIGDGLIYAHLKGIIHRDLKPENIIIQDIKEKPIIKIIDFGIAKKIKNDSITTNLTLDSNILGTPLYLAPEQVLKGEVNVYTDQYSLALIIYEMLTGTPVRNKLNIQKILFDSIKKPISQSLLNHKKVPINTQRLLFKATMPNPKNRFKDLKTFIHQIIESLEEKKTEKKKEDQTNTLSKVERKWEKKGFVSIEDEVRIERKKRILKIIFAFLLLIIIIFGISQI